MTNHLWQSTLFAGVAGLLTVALRKNRAQVRYWLWLSASLKFLVPFSLLLGLGSHLQWTPAALKIAATPAVAVPMVQITAPFPETTPMATSTPPRTDWTPFAILGIWMCGAGAIALIRFRGWLRIRAAVRASVPIEISASVEVRSSPGLLEPGVVGWLRPILLLPDGIAERLTPPQLDAVLAHELYHVRRRDNLFAAIHMLVEAMFWFHPLVWWIGARLVEERERACDEAVLNLGAEPMVYAEGILNVCKLYVESPLACASGATGSDVKKRIEAILTNRLVLRLNFPKKLALAGAAIVALSLPIVVGSFAQSRGAAPKFDVASIRRGCPGDEGTKGPPFGWIDHPSPGRVSFCFVLQTILEMAYFTDCHWSPQCFPRTFVPVEGSLPWLGSDRYMLDAKAEGNPPQEVMRGPMLRALLEDRFKLKVHREIRQVPVYELTVAKGGPKLKRFEEGSCIPFDLFKQGPKTCNQRMDRKGPNEVVAWHGTSLDEFSKTVLTVALDRPVIDKTGIAGKFEFHLVFAPDQSTPILLPGGDMANNPIVPSDDPAGPSIFTAIQEQLGLKLQPAKGPREFLVIDHVERPSEN
jgi:bla regulator protein blaR1